MTKKRQDMSLSEAAKDQLTSVETSLSDLDKFVEELERVDYDQVTSQLGPEDKARLDLTILYAVNSLYWMLQRSQGNDPQKHGIRGEIERIRERMVQLKQVQDRAKRPRLDTPATERIVRHELNLQKKKKMKTAKEENWENERKEGES